MNDPGAERRLLHLGGGGGTWGSLGLWAPGRDYAQACEALALQVGQDAGIQAGDRVLSVGCGAGDELRVWAQHFGAREVVGLEHDPHWAATAARQCSAWGLQAAVLQGSGSAMLRAGGLQPGLEPASFDRIVCVDAAYFLRPREAFLRAAWQLLKPGGQLAYTDLTLNSKPSPWGPLALRAAASLCGLQARDLLSPGHQQQRLQALGFDAIQRRSCGDAVLRGFADFVKLQGRRHRLGVLDAAWRRPAITARLIAPCRAAGLDYLVLSAIRPGVLPPPLTPPLPMAALTS